MAVRDIIKKWLVDNGYDGLCGEECGCLLDDLMTCEEGWALECEPGYKVPCPGPDKCEYDCKDWHVRKTKPEVDDD